MSYSDRQHKTTNVDYLNKDFGSLKSNLVEYAKTYFPNSYKDFNETSPGMMLIEMGAYVGDVLSYYIDQQYKEMMLPLAEERRNLINISNMMGYKVKPSIPAYVDIKVTQTVAAQGGINAKSPNYSQAMIIDKGMQIQSSVDSNIKFETLDIVDFTVSSSYDLNPSQETFDANGIVATYKLARTVKAMSSETKTKNFTIDSPQQYLTLTLPETDVIEITSVEDTANGNRWYEVDYLAQDKIPVETHYTSDSRTNAYQDVEDNVLNMAVPFSLQYLQTGKRFVTEIGDDNKTSLVFGNGVLRNGTFNQDAFVNLQQVGIIISGTTGTEQLDTSLDPLAGDSRMTLGETPANTTLKVTYRIGGGVSSNVPSNDLNAVVSKTLLGGTTDSGKNLTVTNDTAAYGGGSGESVEEIRNKAKAYFATQNRAVTKDDYEYRSYNMPAKFGSIAKVFANRSAIDVQGSSTEKLFSNLDFDSTEVLNNADFNTLQTEINTSVGQGSNTDALDDILINVQDFYNSYTALRNNIGTEALATIDLYVLGYNSNKQLVAMPTGSTGNIVHPMKQNLKNYLDNYRMITDQINITDGKIINFGVAFDIVAHRSSNKADVKLRCINKIRDYFNIEKMHFHQPIYTGDLEYGLMDIDGVRSVNWVQLTQGFDSLQDESLPGSPPATPLWDYNFTNPSGGGGTTGYGWQYDFAQFYNKAHTNFVSTGVILPSKEPAVFELKYPNTNIRGVVR